MKRRGLLEQVTERRHASGSTWCAVRSLAGNVDQMYVKLAARNLGEIAGTLYRNDERVYDRTPGLGRKGSFWGRGATGPRRFYFGGT